MPHVSRIKLPKNIESQLLENFDSVLSSISDRERMIMFLNALLTNTERLMLAKRLAAVVLISEELDDSKISRALNITRITVAKIRYYYESRAREGYDIALKEIQSKRIKAQFRKMLDALGRYAARAAGGRVTPGIFD